MPAGRPNPCTSSPDDVLATLRRVLPEREHVLTGWPEILAYLHDVWGLRRYSGKLLTVTQVRRWRHASAFPMVPGGTYIRGRKGHTRQLPLTSAFLITAWIITRDPTERLFAWLYTSQRKCVPGSGESTRARPPRVAREEPPTTTEKSAHDC
jgi:hypothetical protein